MALLTREQIVEASKAQLPRRTKSLIPELGGDVIVRGMSGKELSLFNESLFTGKGKKRKVVTVNIQAKMAVRCLEDADGTPAVHRRRRGVARQHARRRARAHLQGDPGALRPRR
jgi:hypothetical protein